MMMMMMMMDFVSNLEWHGKATWCTCQECDARWELGRMTQCTVLIYLLFILCTFQPPWDDQMGWLSMAVLIGSSRSIHQDLLNTFPSMRRAQAALKHDELRPKLSLAAANGFEPIHHFVILTSCMEEILNIRKW